MLKFLWQITDIMATLLVGLLGLLAIFFFIYYGEIFLRDAFAIWAHFFALL